LPRPSNWTAVKRGRPLTPNADLLEAPGWEEKKEREGEGKLISGIEAQERDQSRLPKSDFKKKGRSRLAEGRTEKKRDAGQRENVGSAHRRKMTRGG